MTSEHIYKFFADYIYKHSGIYYKESDFYRLDSRLNTMMKSLSCATVEDLHKAYTTNVTKDMHSLLINIATNNETYFMRDNKPFLTLVNKVIPEILANNKSLTKLSIWCAGCSTGQEPYSILMSIAHKCTPDVLTKTEITATDISTDALSKAKKATYDGLDVQRGLPAPLLVKYFIKESDEAWRINDTIRSRVTFGEFNLLTDNFPASKYNIIFCRNVLIYQDKDNRKSILEKFYKALVPGGVFFMGSGESVIGLGLDFKQEIIDGTLVYKKPA